MLLPFSEFQYQPRLIKYSVDFVWGRVHFLLFFWTCSEHGVDNIEIFLDLILRDLMHENFYFLC